MHSKQHYIKEGNYKKILVLFKSKKNEALEIIKSKNAQWAILNIIREDEYREFIVTDKKNKEFRIREEKEKEEEEIKQLIIEDTPKPSKQRVKVINLKD